MLLQVRDDAQFDERHSSRDAAIAPGKIYLSLYKNIPHHDLELLFPNLKISMSLKDRLMLTIPALGAAVPLVLKILPSWGS